MGWRVEIQQDSAWKVVPPADYGMSHEEALALAGGYANARIVSSEGSVEPVTERGDSSMAAEHDRPRGRPIPEDEAGITVVDPKTKKTRLFETRGVLGGAYRGKSVSKRELLTHAYEVTEGKWGAEKSLCGKIKAESLSDEDEHAWPSCAACANRLTKLGASEASVKARENPTRAKEQFWPFDSAKFVIYGQHPDGTVEMLTRAKTERGAQVIIDEYRRGAKLTGSGIQYWYDRAGAQEKPRAKESASSRADISALYGTFGPYHVEVGQGALRQGPELYFEGHTIGELSMGPGHGETIEVDKIFIEPAERHKGHARAAMLQLCKLADAQGLTITLTPDSSWGGSVARLKQFYKSLGFVENKGRRKDFAISESMYRLPAQSAKENPARPPSAKRKHEALKRGSATPVDPRVLAYIKDPGPDERTVLILATVYNDVGPRRAAVPWDLQEKAARFYNQHGLEATLNEIVRLGGPEYLEPARENPHAADYPDIESALQGAQSKFDATHAVRGKSVTIFSPTSRGYIKRIGFHEKGFYHWPEKGEVVSELPSNAEMIYQLIQVGWDPEVAPASVPQRRAAEDSEHADMQRYATRYADARGWKYVPNSAVPASGGSWDFYVRKGSGGTQKVRVEHWDLLRAAEGGEEFKLGDHVIMLAGKTIGAGKLKQDWPGEIDRVETSSVGKVFYGVSYVDRKGKKRHTYADPHELRRAGEAKENPPRESSWCVTWINPTTRKRQVYFDELSERTAYAEARTLRMHHPNADFRAERCSASLREEPLENPIEASNNSGWAKITRDPKAHAEAMARAQEIGPINNAKAVYELLSEKLAKEDQEVFLVLPLDIRGHLRCEPVEVHRGARSRVDVSVPDVLRAVIEAGGEGFCVVHNHPTGLADPSKADGDLTKAIRKGAGNVDLAFVDHVVIGRQQYYSFEDKKLHRVKGKKP